MSFQLNKTMFKITTKTKVDRAMYIMRCPACGFIAASASEYDLLPAFIYCDRCPYDTFIREGKQYIERTSYPRFEAEISFNGIASDLEGVNFKDECSDPGEIARAMSEAGDYIAKYSR